MNSLTKALQCTSLALLLLGLSGGAMAGPILPHNASPLDIAELLGVTADNVDMGSIQVLRAPSYGRLIKNADDNFTYYPVNTRYRYDRITFAVNMKHSGEGFLLTIDVPTSREQQVSRAENQILYGGN